jgi:adenosine deaminase
VVEAALAGFERSQRRPITMGLLLSAIRHPASRAVEIAELAIRHRDHGVLAFDMAGPEAGYPPTRYLDAFQLIKHENFHSTLHAGEAFGLPSIWEALQWCGAERLGHGVRIVDDITVRPDGHVSLGRLAAYVRDTRVPIEMCPTSNVHIGAVRSIADHPIDLLRRLRFRVTVNTDNRLMSGISLTDEFAPCPHLGSAQTTWTADPERDHSIPALDGGSGSLTSRSNQGCTAPPRRGRGAGYG